MTYIKTLFFTLITTFLLSSAHSQTIKRQSINSIGGSGKINHISIHHTSGQSYSTKSYSDSKFSSRPGFQQPESFFITDENNVVLNLDVFPNPTSYEFTISSKNEILNAYLIITDITGKIVLEKKYTTLQALQINCSNWTNGTYIILLKSEQSEIYSSKLIISK